MHVFVQLFPLAEVLVGRGFYGTGIFGQTEDGFELVAADK